MPDSRRVTGREDVVAVVHVYECVRRGEAEREEEKNNNLEVPWFRSHRSFDTKCRD
jgi:hypothetical protein